MNLILNILWFIFGGIFIFFEYIVGGIAMCITIIGIPFGLQSFKLAFAHLAPFGKEVIEVDRSSPNLYLLLNIIWIVIAGFWIALTHLALGIVFCITIIGIPFGLQHFKFMQLCFAPFGYNLREKN